MILKNKIRSILSLTALTLAMTASQAFADAPWIESLSTTTDPMSATPGAGGDDQDSLYLHYTVVGVNQIDVVVDAGETDSKELTDIRTAVSMEVAKLHVKSNQVSTIHACSENASHMLLEAVDGSTIGSSADPLTSVYYEVELSGGGIEGANAGMAAPAPLAACTAGAVSAADQTVGEVDQPENSMDQDYPAGTARTFDVSSAGNADLLTGKYSDTIRFLIAPVI